MEPSIKYPQRPKPVGLCKCGHKYTDHKLTDNDDRWAKGNWFQRNILRDIMFMPLNIKREACHDCMCEMYEQVKIIDEKTGDEIKESSK